MNCQTIQQLLPGYQDGQLATGESRAIEEHLRGCALCQRELDLLAKTWSLLGTLEPISPSATFKASFWEKVRQQEEDTAWHAWPRLAPAFGAFLGVWILGVGIGAAAYLHTHTAPAPVLFGMQNSSLGNAYLRHSAGDRL